MRAARLVLAASLLALGLAPFATPAAAGEVTVTVGHQRLEPAEVRIAKGDTVVFHNVDAMPGGHTVAADDGAFASPPLEKDQRWSHTFAEAGTHVYRIREHPDAQGTVIVE